MPNEKGNRYAIHALKDRRATMAGEIVQRDAVLRELDPSYRADTLPPKRLRRVKAIRQRGIEPVPSGPAKAAEKPLASSDIADAIVEAKGYERDSIHALTRRVRANLSYLLRHKRVVKTGDRLTARWSLPEDQTKEAAN